MPRAFSSLFARQIEAQLQVHAFVSGLTSRLTDDGSFALGLGQPIRSPYRYIDEDSGEVVWLWRTPEDEARHERYRVYRAVLEEGMIVVTDPDLAKSRRHDGRPPRTRAYDIPQMLSSAYTDLVCGREVVLETGLPELDQLLERMGTKENVAQWIYEASVFDMVGVEPRIDPDAGTVDLQRVQPDYLFEICDEQCPEEVVAIARREWLPLDEAPKWEPLHIRTKALQGWNPDRHIAKSQYMVGPGDELEQDGFVFEELHFRGWIEWHLYATVGSRIIAEIPLGTIERGQEVAERPLLFTGMPDFAITLLKNVGRDGRARSDWDGIVELTADFCERASRNARFVDMYSMPTPVVPQSFVQIDPWTGRASWAVQLGGTEAIVQRPTDKVEPKFLQPNADFNAPAEDLKFALGMLGTLSQLRHVIDPEVLATLDTGVALKLKIGPAMTRVAPRKAAHVAALKKLLFNLVSALEYHTAKPLVEDEKPLIGTLLCKGGVHDAVVTSSRREELLARFKRAHDGLRISFAAFRDTMRRARVSSADDEGPDLGVRPRQVAEMLTPAGHESLTPEAVPVDYLERQVGAIAVASVISETTIRVKLVPGMPQDHAEAARRVSDGTMSLYRLLTEFDGMDDKEAQEEIRRIMEEQASKATPDLLTDDGGGPTILQDEDRQLQDLLVREHERDVVKRRQDQLPTSDSVGGGLSTRSDAGEPAAVA